MKDYVPQLLVKSLCGLTCPGGHICTDLRGHTHDHRCANMTLNMLEYRTIVGRDRVESELLREIGNGDLYSREVYTDWLEERGESTMTEFVRLQCDMARFRYLNTEFQSYQHRTCALLPELLPRWCWYITRHIVKDTVENRQLIVAEQFRRCLKLRPWDEFALEVRQRNAEYSERGRIIYGDYLRADRRSGRTTRLIVKALARYVVTNSDMMLLVTSTRGVKAVVQNSYIVRNYAARLGISLRYSTYDSRDPDYNPRYRNYTYFQDHD